MKNTAITLSHIIIDTMDIITDIEYNCHSEVEKKALLIKCGINYDKINIMLQGIKTNSFLYPNDLQLYVKTIENYCNNGIFINFLHKEEYTKKLKSALKTDEEYEKQGFKNEEISLIKEYEILYGLDECSYLTEEERERMFALIEILGL